MGRFLLGSTVVLLFPAGVLRFNPEWTPARRHPHGRADGPPLGHSGRRPRANMTSRIGAGRPSAANQRL